MEKKVDVTLEHAPFMLGGVESGLDSRSLVRCDPGTALMDENAGRYQTALFSGGASKRPSGCINGSDDVLHGTHLHHACIQFFFPENGPGNISEKGSRLDD
jgi:hypothetical protein